MPSLLDFLFPKRCVSCSAIGQYICDSCAKKIEKYPNQKCLVCLRLSIDGITHPVCRSKLSIDGAVTAFAFKGPIKDAIYKLKYQSISDMVDFLVDLLIDDLKPSNFVFNNKFKIIAVPLHQKRLNKRGYNQAELLVTKLAIKTNLGFVDDLLIKNSETKPQVELSRELRLKNLKGAFMVSERANVLGGDFLLIDDVRTTGTTLKSCAQVLKRAGANSVWGLTIAAN